MPETKHSIDAVDLSKRVIMLSLERQHSLLEKLIKEVYSEALIRGDSGLHDVKTAHDDRATLQNLRCRVRDRIRQLRE